MQRLLVFALASPIALPLLSIEASAAVPRLVSQESATPEIDVRFVDSEAHSFTGEERRVITGVSEAAVAEIAAILTGVPPRIELVVQAGPEVIPETGEAGMALAPGRIGWTVDPGRPGGVAAIAREKLRHTLFHEVHHLARGWTVEGRTVGSRMIDAVVSEGMATAFERDAAGWRPPWGEYPAGEVAGWVDELRAVAGFETYATWMFRHPDGRRWIGYRAGTYLTDQAMAASGRSAAELVSTPTDEILSLAIP
jgi:hypothetical protein